MDLLRRALLATVACSWLFLSGCGTYRPIASTLPLAPGNPQLTDTVAVYNLNPNTNNVAGATGTMTILSVAGDTNLGNYQIGANDTLTAATPPLNPLTSRLITFAGGNTFTAAANPAQGTPHASPASVTLVNTLTGSSQQVTLPAEFTPSFITATATTNLVLVSLQPLSTATAFPTCGAAGIGAIGIISAATGTLNNTVCAGSKPGFIQVAQNDTVAFILDLTDKTNNVRVVNLAVLSPTSTTSVVGTVGTTPIWASISVDGSTLYVLNQGSNNISVIDVAEELVTTPSITTGTLSTPSVIITDPSLNRLYISNTGNNTVSVLDASNSTLPALHIVSTGIGVAPVTLGVTSNGAAVYVANTGSNFVSVINANSFNVTTLTPIASTIDSSAKIQAVAVSKDGTKAYMAVTVSSDLANANNTSGNGVFVVLTSTNAFVTNASGNQINIAPPQDLSCDATETCTGALLQRPVQIVPRL